MIRLNALRVLSIYSYDYRSIIIMYVFKQRLFTSVTSGVTGLLLEPIKGAQSDGFSGLAKVSL